MKTGTEGKKLEGKVEKMKKKSLKQAISAVEDGDALKETKTKTKEKKRKANSLCFRNLRKF